MDNAKTGEKITVWSALKGTSGTVRFLLLGAFVNQLGYFVQAYLVVFMLARGYSTLEASWGLAAFCGASIFGTLVGPMIDAKIGSRLTIVFSGIAMGIAVGLVPSMVQTKLPLMVAILSITLCGFFAQMYRPSVAIILSKNFAENQRVLGFSMLRIALNMGGAIGPLFATILAKWDWSYVFWLNATSSLLYAVIAFLRMPDDRPHGKKNEAGPAVAGGAQSGWNVVLTDIKFWSFLWAMFLSSMVFIQFTSTVPVAMEAKGLALDMYSTLLTVYAVATICCELKISSIVANYSPWIPATIGTTVLCLGVASFGLTLDSSLIALSAVILVAGTMSSGPTMFAHPAKYPIELRGKYIGITQATFSLGNAVGPIAGLWLFKMSGNTIFTACAVLAVISGALVVHAMYPRKAA